MKVLWCLMLVAGFTTSVVAQYPTLDYERKKLEVLVESKGVAEARTYNYGPWGRYGSSTSLEASEQKSWRATLGGRRVSESKFYGIAGLTEEMKLASSRERNRTTGAVLMGIGILPMVIGIGGGMIESQAAAETGGEMKNTTGYLVTGIGGAVLTLAGAGLFFTNQGNATEAGFAFKVAEAYNQQLRIKLGIKE